MQPSFPYFSFLEWSQLTARQGHSNSNMPSEDSIIETINDKFITAKEELEELIDEVKNEVDDKAVQISSNKRYQEQSFDQLHTAMEKLRKDLKQMGETNWVLKT